jgi:hypothetical protein
MELRGGAKLVYIILREQISNVHVKQITLNHSENELNVVILKVKLGPLLFLLYDNDQQNLRCLKMTLISVHLQNL